MTELAFAEVVSLVESLKEAGQTDLAEQVWQAYLLIHPQDDRGWLEFGQIALNEGRFQEAASRFLQAARLTPNAVALWLGLITCGLQTAQFPFAEQSARDALQREPENETAQQGLCAALVGQSRFDEALAFATAALDRHPFNSDLRISAATALGALRQTEEALSHLDFVLALHPKHPAAGLARGRLLQDLMRHEEALAQFDLLIAQDPGFTEAIFSRAFSHLILENWRQGFVDYEARYLISARYSRPHSFTAAVWSGTESLKGKSVLIHCEQGLGDTLHFARFIKPVVDLGAQVHLMTRPPLASLLRRIGGVCSVSVFGQAAPATDFQISFISLPAALQISNQDAFGAPSPYLTSDSDRVKIWNARLGAPKRLRVGLVWAGGERDETLGVWNVNARRNIALSALAPLFDLPIDLIALQKGTAALSEIGDWCKSRTAHFQNLGPELGDFDDTAAVIIGLDLVVSVDTAVVHLAGALGKQVFMLNRFDSCWRWGVSRRDSPWYPTLRQYRQPRPGDWQTVVLEMTEAVKDQLRPSRLNI